MGTTKGFAHFLSSTARRTIGPPLAAAGAVDLLLAIATGALAYFRPDWSAPLGVSPWLAPAAVLVLGVVIIFPIAAYGAYDEVVSEGSKLLDELSKLRSSRPHVVFQKGDFTPLYRRSDFLQTGSYVPHRGYVVEAWFTNNPETPGEESSAREVTALLRFFRPAGETPLCEIVGTWATTAYPSDAAPTGFSHKTDIPASANPVKLMVAFRGENDDDAYAFDSATFLRMVETNEPSHCLPLGEYVVRVHLIGIGINREYELLLVNEGCGKDLALTELLK